MIKAMAVKQAPASVDLNRLFQTESNFIADAIGKKGDMGLGQLTPIAVADWNKNHPNEQYNHAPEDMFHPETNAKISNWAVNIQAPKYLKALGLPDTVDNRLAMYKSGYGNMKSGEAWKSGETQKYINKYKTIKVTGQPVSATGGTLVWQ